MPIQRIVDKAGRVGYQARLPGPKAAGTTAYYAALRWGECEALRMAQQTQARLDAEAKQGRRR